MEEKIEMNKMTENENESKSENENVNKSENENGNKYLIYGLCFGPMAGMALAYVLGYDPTTGICYGPLVGLAIATLVKYIVENKQKENEKQ